MKVVAASLSDTDRDFSFLASRKLHMDPLATQGGLQRIQAFRECNDIDRQVQRTVLSEVVTIRQFT